MMILLQTQSSLMEAMFKSMEDMTNSTYLKYKQKSGTRRPQTLFLFVSSIARTNLEIEIVQRGGSLLARPQPNPLIPKRSCIGKDSFSYPLLNTSIRFYLCPGSTILNNNHLIEQFRCSTCWLCTPGCWPTGPHGKPGSSWHPWTRNSRPLDQLPRS